MVLPGVRSLRRRWKCDRARRVGAPRAADADTRSGVTHSDPVSTRSRRPQWRGERDAVLVRMPTPLGEQLRAEAARRRMSLSDFAAELIRYSLFQVGR